MTENGVVLNRKTNKQLTSFLTEKGYERISLYGFGQYYVHRLVAMIYIPNPDHKPQVNHKDGNKLNNHVSNLEWVTNQENRDHALQNGLHCTGEKCPYAKLTEDNVNYIRSNPDNLSNLQLASMFGVHKQHISDIKHYKRWKNS